MTHPDESRIQDYVDDLLCREERAELEQHLAACPACNGTVLRARELQRALRELPRDLAPPAHLLEEIHARIDAQPLREADGGRRRLLDRSLRSLRPLLAAAAVVLVALSSAVTALLVGRDAPAPVPTALAPAGGAALLAVERPYQREADALRAALTGGRETLAPETIRILEENLRVIDGALAEARAALRDDPNNGTVLELLRATHERRLDLLRQARRWTQGT